MFNYFLWSLSFVASVSTWALPSTIQKDVYIVPTYAEDNTLTLHALPEIQLKSVPRKTDFDWGPSIQSKAALVMDEDSGAILWQKNESSKLPIASITKLMTILVAFDEIKEWDAVHAMEPGENALIGASFPAGNGDEFTITDILKTTLVASANNAALALAHSTGLTDEEFVQAMNDKAAELGMTASTFVEPTGLEDGNRSTVQDVAILMRAAARDERVMEAIQKTEHSMTRTNGDDKPEITVRTTNRLVKNNIEHIIGGKTGFTNEAGHCLVTLAENEDGNRILVVVLGGPDETTRFDENAELVNWTFDHYQWD